MNPSLFCLNTCIIILYCILAREEALTHDLVQGVGEEQHVDSEAENSMDFGSFLQCFQIILCIR